MNKVKFMLHFNALSILSVNFDLTQWYHYVLLAVLLAILFVIIKYYYSVEKVFKPKTGIQNGVKSGKSMLISSFVLGLIMVLIWMFKPSNLSSETEKYWIYVENICYGLFIMLILINIYFSFTNYKLRSSILRIIIVSGLMFIYFYSGMYGGLLILIALATLIIIYSIFRLKKTLTLR